MTDKRRKELKRLLKTGDKGWGNKCKTWVPSQSELFAIGKELMLEVERFHLLQSHIRNYERINKLNYMEF